MGASQLVVLDLEAKKMAEKWSLAENFKKVNFEYDCILDLELSSNPERIVGDDDYRCQVACRRNGRKTVDIFDIDYDFAAEEKLKADNERGDASIKKQMTSKFAKTGPRKTIPFLHEPTDTRLFCKIATDFKSIILTNGYRENYLMVEESQGDGSDTMVNTIKRLPQLKGKSVQYIKQHDDRFYLACWNEYDTQCEIVHTGDDPQSILFEKNIEPGIMQILDMNIDEDGHKQPRSVRLASLLNYGFYIDRATISRKKKKENITFENDVLSPMQGFSTKWPYITFSGLIQNCVLLLNCYDNDILHRIELGHNPDHICFTQITDTNDLFILSQKDDEFLL